MALKTISLDDKYTANSGTLYMTGNQALVRLPLLQKQRDIKNGLNTAGYISGYRGSPIGTYDMELVRARKYLDANDIVFQPGVNEDLAATSVWGTQQLEAESDRKYDGVFAAWYGKGPGVFRSGDALKHGCFYGASKQGGVLIITGDDHTAKSSTIAHYSDPEMIAHGSPVLYPSTIQEVIDFGLIGWALSRYSGAWVTLKVVNETIEATGTVDLNLNRSMTRNPEGQTIPLEAHFTPPQGGLGPAQTAEKMALSERIPLIKAFARLNKFDKITLEAEKRTLGIVSSGKVYLDLLKALDLLGLTDHALTSLGISLYKVAMIWPLEDISFSEFAKDQVEILVIEEKQPLLEQQITQILYNYPNESRPQVIGKRDEKGTKLQETYGAISPDDIVQIILKRLTVHGLVTADIKAAADLNQKRMAAGFGAVIPQITRLPYFCSGCPHNSSTKVPEGSTASGGIGCHAMAGFMNRKTIFPCQMGGEGHSWVGLSHFVNSKHRFQNLGDGTYMHSGLHAVHAAVVQEVNITYKLLFNEAVAMTGGQPVEGTQTVQQISFQAQSFGVRKIAVTTDDPTKYKGQPAFAPGTTVHHRDQLDRLQREFREISGVTMIIHDQTCAAEKRRMRKRGTYPDPKKRVFINELVCEACGDCSVQANCVSIQTKQTDYGNKRIINQSTCNKDYSCVDGFCPSFVTVLGGDLKKAATADFSAGLFADLPLPSLPKIDKSYAIMINGIGGTGVVTIGAVLGMAAHLEDKAISIYDMTGFAQKGGAVQSHLQIGHSQDDIKSITIGPGAADLILGCDLVVTASEGSMRSILPGHTKAVVNDDPVETAVLQLVRDFKLPTDILIQGIEKALGDNSIMIGATKIAQAIMGDTIAANMFLVGFAFQKGWIPISAEAIMTSIEMNAIAVEFNQNAFMLGRLAAHDYRQIEALLPASGNTQDPIIAKTPAQALAHRVAFLCDYQDAAYAEEFTHLVEKVIAVEKQKFPGKSELSEAVVKNYFKLMAYKDEYEVARLYTDGRFMSTIENQFDGNYHLQLSLAPPLWAKKDPVTGVPKKRQYGQWILKAFGLLAKFKRLRGTAFDPFGYMAERRMERRLIREYHHTIKDILDHLNPHNYDIAVKVACLPEDIRGFGHVKAAAIIQAEADKITLLKAFAEAVSH